MVNPYSTIADVLAQVALDWPALVELLGATIERNDSGRLKLIKAGDSGELVIRPYAGGGANFNATSTSSHFVQNFQYVLHALTGEEEPVPSQEFWDLKWELDRALAHGFQKRGHDLGLRSLGVGLQTLKVLDTSDESNNEEFNRGSFGWTSLRAVSAVFSLKHADMEI